VSSHPSYPNGQCTRYVADTWDGGEVGPYWGDAHAWPASAQADGYLISPNAFVDTIAVWGANMGGARAAGHVAIVTGVNPLTVRESNWTRALVPDTRTVTDTGGIIAFILPRSGGAKPVDPMDVCRGFVLTQYHIFRPGGEPAQSEVDYWAARMIKEGVETIIQTMRATPEYSADAAREAAEKAAP
jgi:hypothetical protein